MCGIVAYIGRRNALPIVLNGIARLDYRGYDSVGVTVQNSGTLTTFKDKGKIADLRKSIDHRKIPGTLAIGHTRWATHGKPSRRNAHPHLSCDNSLAVVHNGIIENFNTLKEVLVSEGHVFRSETDTEVISHLIEHAKEKNLEDGVVAALKQVHGTYGLAIVNNRERKIVVARNGSPLVLGIIGKGEYIVASDITAITEHTKKVIYLEDGDVGVLTDDGYRLFNLQNVAQTHAIKTIDWSVAAIEKRGFEHFMLKEIFEQPETLKAALSGRYDNKNQVPKFGGINIPPFDLKQIERVMFLACGTSYHAGLVGEYYLEKYAGLKVEVAYASEFLCKEEKLSPRDLVIPVSQSGETADTLMALRKANREGAHSLGVVNTVGSTIAREVNGGGLYIHVGPEIGVASTKAYTGHLLNMYLLSIYLGRFRGVIKAGEAETLMQKARAVPRLAAEALKCAPKVLSIAKRFKNASNFIYLGRGINYPTAMEGALKLKEISYIHAEGFPAAEMKHGPIALVDKHMPVVFIVKRDDGYEKILSNIEEIKARKGIVIAVVEKEDRLVEKKADYVIRVPATTAELSPIIFVIPLQLLAYHIARLRGCAIDKPRNLAKSVTVE